MVSEKIVQLIDTIEQLNRRLPELTELLALINRERPSYQNLTYAKTSLETTLRFVTEFLNLSGEVRDELEARLKPK